MNELRASVVAATAIVQWFLSASSAASQAGEDLPSLATVSNYDYIVADNYLFLI